MAKFLTTLAVVFVCVCAECASAADNFVKVTLPKGVSIELPRNWVVLTKSTRITLDTAVQSALDMSNLEQSNSILPFAANFYSSDGATLAMVSARFYPELGVGQAEAEAATAQDIIELDGVLRESLSKGLNAIGGKIASWRGTRREKINGIIVFVTEYSRPSLKSEGHFKVRLIRALMADRSFTVIVSYLDSQETLLKLITDRVVWSLRATGHAKAPTNFGGGAAPAPSAVSSQEFGLSDEPAFSRQNPVPVSEKRAGTASIMESTFGENWALGLGFSLFVTWGVGLIPPLLLRFAVLRRPMGRWWAVGTVSFFWILNLLMVMALGSKSKTHVALTLVAFASFYILRKGAAEQAQRARAS